MEFLEEKAVQAEENGDLDLALELWKVLAQKDRDPVFFTCYGRVAHRLEKWDEAEAAFAQALRIDPKSALATVAMGHLWASRTDKGDLGSLETAKTWFLRSLEHERNPRTLTLLGATYRALDDNASARDVLTEAIELDPNYEEALYNLAISEEERDPRRSLELLERAIEIDPSYSAAHQSVGMLYQKMGDLQKAEYHFRRDLEIDQTEVWPLLYLANVLAIQGKLERLSKTTGRQSDCIPR